MSESEVRSEYSKLRSIANKRLQRQANQNIGITARTGYKFPTIKDISTSNKMSYQSMLADVSKFLRSPRTTVTGEKAFLATFVSDMTNAGYGELVQNIDDIYNLIKFMDDLREQYGSKLFDSGDALDAVQQAQRLNIPMDKLKDNFDLFASNLDKMEKLKPSKNGAVFSQRRINNLIKKWS